MNTRRALLVILLGATFASRAAAAERLSRFDVRDYGAKGDGTSLDTDWLNRAVEACAAAGGGEVVVPPGKYLTGTVLLKSNVTLLLDAGAELIGTKDLEQYRHFTPPEGTPLVGGSVLWHRAMIIGDGVENVTIAGCGFINGNNVTDQRGEEGVRGPHAVLFGNCRKVAVRDVSIQNAGNYAVLFEFTNQVEVRGVKITGGYDGVHLRGWTDRPCRGVTISDCEFYTGDDCVAGWHWDDVLVERCVFNSASNGLRLFGPVKKVIVRGCRFFGPGRYAWRTSGLLKRTNMAAGVCIQPSAWGETPGTVDDVRVSDVVMHDVTTPLHVVANAPSSIGHVTIDRLSATGVYRAAASFESWSVQPIGRIDFRDSSITYIGGFGRIFSDAGEAAMALLNAQADAEVRPPGVDSRRLPAWGLYARRVKTLNLTNVRLGIEKPDTRPAVMLDGVDELDVDGLRWPSGTERPMDLRGVGRVTQGLPSKPPAIRVVEAKCERLGVSRDRKSVTATVRALRTGLAEIVLKVDGKPVTRWAWLVAGEPADVVFANPPQLDGESRHEIICGEVRAN